MESELLESIDDLSYNNNNYIPHSVKKKKQNKYLILIDIKST